MTNRIRIRILIVEDDSAYREPMAAALLSAGYDVRTVVDGAEGLEVLRDDSPDPDLIVLDLVLPLVDGWEFLRMAREDARFAAIPVIVTTSVARTRDIPDGVVLLRKPFTASQLLREAHAAVRRRKQSRAP